MHGSNPAEPCRAFSAYLAIFIRWPIFIVLAKCNRLSRFATPIWHQSSTRSSALIRVLFGKQTAHRTCCHRRHPSWHTYTHSHHTIIAYAKFCGDDAYPAGHHGRRRHHHHFTFTLRSFKVGKKSEFPSIVYFVSHKMGRLQQEHYLN